MAHFSVGCFRDEYHGIVRAVRDRGFERAPRGRKTRDLGFTTITIEDVARPVLPLSTGRGVSRAIAAVETLQLIAAESHPQLMLRIAPRFADYAERIGNGESPHFHGAYGRRIGYQVQGAVQKLKSDRDSRQAVITLWDPFLDNQPDKRDYPCTVALGFALVDDALQLNVIMRSNDAMLGLAYDAFVFTQLQWTVARVLSVEPGRYTHTAWSLHAYADDFERIDDLGSASLDHPQPRGLHDGSSFARAQRIASRLLRGGWRNDDDTQDDAGHADAEWYRSALAPYLG